MHSFLTPPNVPPTSQNGNAASVHVPSGRQARGLCFVHPTSARPTATTSHDLMGAMFSRVAILSRHEELRSPPSLADGLQTRRGLQEAEATRGDACGRRREEAAATSAQEGAHARGDGQVRAEGLGSVTKEQTTF